MGKRKSSAAKRLNKKVKLAVKLETVFDCPFCGHKGSVACEIDKELWVAEATCCVCKESFCCKAHTLTEPIDVYSEWIDECVRANELD